jgi:hypothetical protein
MSNPTGRNMAESAINLEKFDDSKSEVDLEVCLSFLQPEKLMGVALRPKQIRGGTNGRPCGLLRVLHVSDIYTIFIFLRLFKRFCVAFTRGFGTKHCFSAPQINLADSTQYALLYFQLLFANILAVEMICCYREATAGRRKQGL